MKSQRSGVVIHINGIVQGVGFRPFVYRLAMELEIAGSVRNDGMGVVIEAHASAAQLAKFIDGLRHKAPPLAKIDSIESAELAIADFTKTPDKNVFTILLSGDTSGAQAAIPADMALCGDCAKETLDPHNRRYNYPFTNCTNCGPRYSIVSEVPYDRKFTSMQSFPMCEQCREEYDNPLDRRFHAQPNACPVCGPKLWLGGDISPQTEEEPLAVAAAALAAGKIVAIRALGGYQLAVDATSEEAVARLRSRKKRPEKPLAIMAAEKSLHRIAEVNPKERELLASPQAPIVLLEKKEPSPLAENVAAKMAEIGVMLPATPLHHLLFAMADCPPFLVMTSGNLHGNPICRSVAQAEEELAEIADLFLHHNREILTRVDDSVIRIAADRPLLLRRSRGYAPNSLRIELPLNKELPPLIACGAGLKNTFCLAQGRELIVSQHIGELDNAATFDFFIESFEHIKKLYHIEPEIVVCDKHPDYPSSRFAADITKKIGLSIYRIQHHYAHAAAVLAEHHLEKAIAIVADGTGLGDDGTIWGGEILQVSLQQSKRVGHLAAIPLPGGDRAAVEPWRMALAALHHCGRDLSSLTFVGVDKQKRDGVQHLLTAGIHCPQTSSAGRLFDMAASLLGICQSISYEGQAAMELEAVARGALKGTVASWLKESSLSVSDYAQCIDGIWQVGIEPFVSLLLDGLAKEAKGGGLPGVVLDFHRLFITAMGSVALAVARKRGMGKVVLSGGCMQNRLLLEGFVYLLEKNGMEVFVGEALPVGDGGLSAGQAILGGIEHVFGNTNESCGSKG